jgi:hypothetical protein
VTSTNEHDTAGNTQSPNPASATFTVSAASASITANGATASQTSAQVSFSTDVAAVSTGTYTVQTPNGTVVYSGPGTTDGTDTTKVDLTYTDVFTFSGCNTSGQTSCALTFTVTGETGAAGETQNPPSQVLSATATKDTTGPTLAGVTQADTTQMVFDVNWNEPVSAPQACVTTTCPIRFMSGSTIVASTAAADGGILLTATDNTAADKLTRLTAASAVAGGAYTLTVGAGVVLDLSPQANANLAGSIPFAVTDTTRPTVTGFAPASCIGTACRTLTITYSEKMATTGSGSVIDTSHYTLNGAAVSGTASVDSTGTIVTLTLTSTPPVGANQIAITGVTDKVGNLINPNPTLENFTRSS